MKAIQDRIYETDAALGYQEKAYLLFLEKDKYLVLDVVSSCDHSYKIGDTVDLERYTVEKSSYDIRKSDLYGTFLFDYFLNHFL
ncbi:MAG: hypothetical protein M1579_01365 [Gammaproteobacteria bacterium]|nr:hypothetical protein [Gammaproteobacteria bacterium]